MIRRTHLACGALVCLSLGACAIDMGDFSLTKGRSAPAAAAAEEPVLTAEGRCSGETVRASALRPQAIEPGVTTECDLVALKGQPNDVLIGNDGKGTREVQVLYQEPTGKKIFFFAGNRLVRIFD